MPDPTGGVRFVIPERANYRKGQLGPLPLISGIPHLDALVTGADGSGTALIGSSNLSATREAGNRAGLVVLATGLGKTWLSAFDSEKLRRVLFIAHREEILDQALATFRRIRPNAHLPPPARLLRPPVPPRPHRHPRAHRRRRPAGPVPGEPRVPLRHRRRDGQRDGSGLTGVQEPVRAERPGGLRTLGPQDCPPAPLPHRTSGERGAAGDLKTGLSNGRTGKGGPGLAGIRAFRRTRRGTQCRSACAPPEGTPPVRAAGVRSELQLQASLGCAR